MAAMPLDARSRRTRRSPAVRGEDLRAAATWRPTPDAGGDARTGRAPPGRARADERRRGRRRRGRVRSFTVYFAPGSGPRDWSAGGDEPDGRGPETDDEGHFVPPEPPPLPESDPTTRFAWLAVLGGPLLLIFTVLFQQDMTWWIATLGVGGFLGGFATLVARMRTAATRTTGTTRAAARSSEAAAASGRRRSARLHQRRRPGRRLRRRRAAPPARADDRSPREGPSPRPPPAPPVRRSRAPRRPRRRARRRCAGAGLRSRGVLAAPGRDGPAVLERAREPAEGAAAGPFVEVARRHGVLRAQRGQLLQEHPALRLPLVLLKAQVAAQHPEPGAAEAQHGRGEAPPVQPRRVRQQHVLGGLDRGPERAEDHRAGGGGAARHVHQPALAGEPRGVLAPAEETRGLLHAHDVGGARADDPGERSPVVAHGSGCCS